MAFSAIWIALASLLATFDIKKATDEDGNVIEPIHEYISALVTCVSLFLMGILLYFSPKAGFRNLINAQSNPVQRKQKASSALSHIKRSFNFTSYMVPARSPLSFS